MKAFLTSIFSLFIISISFSQVKRELGTFDFVEVYDKIPVKLVKSNSNYIEISGTGADKVITETKNTKLKIKMAIGHFLDGDKLEVTLYYKDLKEIHANEASQITSEDILHRDHVLLNAKEGASIDLDLNVNSLEIKTNSGGKIKTQGTASSQIVVSNSGGEYDGGDLKTEDTQVTVNAGGEAKVYATKTVKAKTRAGGNIHIFGGAQVSQQTLAGGNIHIH